MSDTPETQEAVERWRQGKINIFDEMARMEIERNNLQDQRDFCMDEIERLRKKRDEAMAKVDRYRKLTTDLAIQRNEAWAALREIAAADWKTSGELRGMARKALEDAK